MKTLSILSLGIFLSGCCITNYSVTKPDGTKVSISNNRVLWTTDSYTVQFGTNGASIQVNKSSTDNAAIAAVAQGVAQGMIVAGTQAVKP